MNSARTSASPFELAAALAQGAESQCEIRLVLRHPRQKIRREFEIAFHLEREAEFLTDASNVCGLDNGH